MMDLCTDVAAMNEKEGNKRCLEKSLGIFYVVCGPTGFVQTNYLLIYSQNTTMANCEMQRRTRIRTQNYQARYQSRANPYLISK